KTCHYVVARFPACQFLGLSCPDHSADGNNLQQSPCLCFPNPKRGIARRREPFPVRRPGYAKYPVRIYGTNCATPLGFCRYAAQNTVIPALWVMLRVLYRFFARGALLVHLSLPLQPTKSGTGSA